MNELSILVVDDDVGAQRALLQVLKKEGYRVDAAPSAVRALEKLKENPVDLLITDIRMERMDGMELMREVRGRWPDIPVIIMTAFASIDTAIRSIHAGAYDYVSKPYEIDELRFDGAPRSRTVAARAREPCSPAKHRRGTRPRFPNDWNESSDDRGL